MEGNIVIAYLSAIIVLFILAKVFILPIKWIARLIGNSLLGLILLWIVNLIGTNFNFSIGINIFTILLSGILGIPGVILLIIVQLIIWVKKKRESVS